MGRAMTIKVAAAESDPSTPLGGAMNTKPQGKQGSLSIHLKGFGL